uniref:Uncharacterized protein n=1 Tax=Anguilla anguilla TaxID=7936 RepID=A0A0E9PN25_ANGAN
MLNMSLSQTLWRLLYALLLFLIKSTDKMII